MSIKILFVAGLVMACCAVASMAEKAEDRARKSSVSDEQIDIALNDPRYLRRQIKCALGEAACDPVGRRLKSLAPLILRGACPQCTADEARQIKKVLSHIQQTQPKEWAKIVKQYAGP